MRQFGIDMGMLRTDGVGVLCDSSSFLPSARSSFKNVLAADVGGNIYDADLTDNVLGFGRARAFEAVAGGAVSSVSCGRFRHGRFRLGRFLLPPSWGWRWLRQVM